jgi:precorrin-6A/cobalt-precorrin-6A reductase
MRHVLVLGGTGDAAKVIEQMRTLPNLTVTASLAGRTPQPNIPQDNECIKVRMGGFGGIDGLVDYIKAQSIELIVDATHPFAAQISQNAAAAASICQIPRVLLNRPAWVKQPDDRWIEAPDLNTAAAMLPEFGKRVFLTIGRQELAAFADVPDCWFLMRMITPPIPPIPSGKILLQQGPFAVEAERELLIQQSIELIVSKNSGGSATYAKIIAARELGLPVLMIPRPALPSGDVVDTIAACVDWVKQQLAINLQ